METNRDHFSDEFDTDSSSTSEPPLDGAGADDFSRYSRYTADSRYVSNRESSGSRPAHASGPLKDDLDEDEVEGRDFTASHGLMSKNEASTLGDESPVARTPVGPRAQRLAERRAASERAAAEGSAFPPAGAGRRREEGEAEPVIPTASSMPGDHSAARSERNASVSGAHAAVSRTSSDPGARLSRTSYESDARLNENSPYGGAQSTANYRREPAQSTANPTQTYAPYPSNYPRSGGAHASNSGPVPPFADGDESRYTSPDAYLQKTRKTKKRRRRIVAVVVTCVLVLVACGAGFAFAMINSINSNLQRNVDQDVLEVLETRSEGEPFYMLLMGTDASDERRVSEEYAGDNFRTDSMMLLRIDPANRKVVCISMMRDTKMDFGEYGIQKLNAAHEIGGTDLAIKTVSKLAAVPISHYAILDFEGFKDVIDLLGGVEVDVQMEINDDMAGGHLDAGLQTLNGEQALILARSRHNYDDIGDGDIYRAANQRMVIAAIAKKVLSSDVSTMIATVEKLSKAVETDLGVMDIVSLGNSMRGMNMDTDFYTATLPTQSEYSDDTWWEILDKPAWKKMMSRVEQGLPPLEDDVIDPFTGIVIANSGSANTIEDSETTAGAGSVNSASIVHSGTVAVRNGCGVGGVAAEAAAPLEAMGFTTDVANASSSDFVRTVVVYAEPDQKAEAQQIRDAIGMGDVVKNDGLYIFDTDFLVVVGQDWVDAGAAGGATQ